MADRGVIFTRKDAQAIAAAVRRVRGIPVDLSGGGALPTGGPSSFLDVCLPAINNTGDELPVFSVVRVDRTIAVESKGAEATGQIFPYRNFVWIATKPDTGLTGQYGITQNRALVGGVVKVLMLGVSKVLLDDTEEGEYANPIDDDFTKMVTASTGKFPVLAVDSDSSLDPGSTWGYVLLGAASTAVGGSFVGRLIDCPDAQGIAHVHKLSGIYFSDVSGEGPDEGEIEISVQCPRGMATQVNGICRVGAADGGTPPWVIIDLLPVYPRVVAAEPEVPSTAIAEAEKGPYQYDPPVMDCEIPS